MRYNHRETVYIWSIAWVFPRRIRDHIGYYIGKDARIDTRKIGCIKLNPIRNGLFFGLLKHPSITLPFFGSYGRTEWTEHWLHWFLREFWFLRLLLNYCIQHCLLIVGLQILLLLGCQGNKFFVVHLISNQWFDLKYTLQ